LRLSWGDHAIGSSPYGAIPWPKVARLNDDEMKRLMIDVVERTYRFIRALFDENTGAELLLRLAHRGPLPQWTVPNHLTADRLRPDTEACSEEVHEQRPPGC
jgi:hypothetical protein